MGSDRVRKGNRLINMDSQIPNKVVEEWLRAGNLFLEPVTVRPETTYGNSRFDFMWSREKESVYRGQGSDPGRGWCCAFSGCAE